MLLQVSAMHMPIETLKERMPKAYAEFMQIAARLEKHYKDMQDVEFTIERGKLWMLQTRNGKRTAQAAVKLAVDMANEGLITKDEAVKSVTPENVDTLLHPQFDNEAKKDAEKYRQVDRQRRECFSRCSSRSDLFRCRYGREDGKRRQTGHHHGAPVHQAR